jgi:hypothetical protein
LISASRPYDENVIELLREGRTLADEYLTACTEGPVGGLAVF